MLRAGRSSLTILVALTATMTLLAVDGAPVLASPPHAATQDLRLQRLETEFQGTTREAFLFVPADLPAGSSLPLVFNYHGFGSSGEGQAGYTNMNAVAEREVFAVLYQDGVGGVRSHNGGSCCPSANDIEEPTDDVGLATLWVELVNGRLAADGNSVDRARIYSTGMSNGGFMSIRLGCEAAGLFAAVSSVTGVLGNEDPATDQFPCDLESTGGLPMPYLHIHGTADSVVPYPGNGGGFKSVAETVRTFRALNGCDDGGGGTPGYTNNTVSCLSFCPADANNVTLCSVEGGGHDWFAPGSCGGTGCADMDSTELVWAFFARHRREGVAATA